MRGTLAHMPRRNRGGACEHILAGSCAVTTLAVVGLGYVGLPLAVEFGKKYPTIGLDLSVEKIEAYKRHVDPTGEVSGAELKAAVHLMPTTDASALKDADFIVIAVPTPVDEAHIPD